MIHNRCLFCGSYEIGKLKKSRQNNIAQCRECGIVLDLNFPTPESETTRVSEAQSLLSGKQIMEKELKRLKERCCLGNEVNVEWLPGEVKQNHGRKLAEEVQNDTISIYSRNPQKSVELVKHGFAEWLLNQHAKPYLDLINHLIVLFEDTQYARKEKIIKALINLMSDRKD